MNRSNPRRAFAAALALLVLAGAQGATPRPAIGSFGIDLGGRDLGVRPGEDFYRYAGGHWLATTTLPPDRTSWGTFAQLREESDEHVRGILEAAAAGNAAPGSVERKIGDYYASFLDRPAIDALGLAPARAGLEAISAATTHEDIARLMARPDLSLPAPIDFGITVDRRDPDRYVVGITHGGLALPDREYYLREDGDFPALRAEYRAHVERLLALAGMANAADAAASVLALETEIAKRHWPRAERRDRDKTYNLRTRAALGELAPGFPWDAALEAADLGGIREAVVCELSAIGPLAELYRATPVTTWRTYLTYHYLRSRAAVLPDAFDREVFDFFGHRLNGQPEQRARWKRAVEATNGALGEGVGEFYVARYFPPAAKTAALALVENLRRAYAERIRDLPWMSDDTKQAAAEKLALFRPKIGYPDRWRDYTALEVRRGDAFGNATRARLFAWHREVVRLGAPTDRDEWHATPQTVNAYYNATFNEILFPAAILQPPFFDAAADAAVNYGAIGAVIGHEMGHGFDDQGAKSDGHGVQHAWWNARDVAAFQGLVGRLADQYSAFEPLPGIKVNGRLTLGENIGDLGGLTAAYVAYHVSLGGRPAPVLEGLSGDQRFFLAYAQVWRALYRDESLRNQLLTDPHSPPRYRVNGVVRNVDAWYQAFGISKDDPLYLPPAERVHIW
ncbi:MAG TPA: M13 family metallopeptidase [Steroidobacteraceae bacterium]|nr:M13 family metallopeptidase [Steroidobacteraceae bacterium]